MRTIEQIPVGMSRLTRKRGNIRMALKFYYTNNYDLQLKH